MSAVRKGPLGTYSAYQHSPKIVGRRRSLFPANSTDSEGESDLGHISPLNFDSGSDQDDLKLMSQPATINDYDILEIVEGDTTATVCTPSNHKLDPNSNIMSPLYLSPQLTNQNTSPSCILKTPHDTCNTNCKLPKLVRKSLLDTSEIPTNKRKLSPYNSPKTNKQIKLDPKNSKVRTTLFPEEDISVSVKSFYPKNLGTMEKILEKRWLAAPSPVQVSTHRRSSSRRKVGEINAGVRHKIRKPRQRKTPKIDLTKASSNEAITDFILTLKEMQRDKSEQGKLIENKENCGPQLYQKEKLIIPALPVKRPEVQKKRSRNSEETEHDSNKKFFKFSKPREITPVPANVEVNVEEGKPNRKEEQTKTVESIIQYDPNDFSMEEPSMISANIESILSQLDDSDNKIVLAAHNSIVASENSILLHEPPKVCPADLILSPISQMCDVTSGLALNSPKRVKNLNAVLDAMPNATNNVFDKKIEVEDKLYSIFYPGTRVDDKKNEKISHATKKKFVKLDKTQMLLDAGQKKFGIIQCSECGFLYHQGDLNDEMIHLNYHEARNILRFKGWKNERVVADFQSSGRIIQILPSDPKSWVKRASDVLEMINNELGCCQTEIDLDFKGQIYLYIKNKFIVGCIMAIPKNLGCRLLTIGDSEVEVCSEPIYPIKCGISRLWVSRSHQKQGIATALMDTVKKNFMLGTFLENSNIAMSSPTQAGVIFSKKYFKTPNFLVYLE